MGFQALFVLGDCCNHNLAANELETVLFTQYCSIVLPLLGVPVYF